MNVRHKSILTIKIEAGITWRGFASVSRATRASLGFDLQFKPVCPKVIQTERTVALPNVTLKFLVWLDRTLITSARPEKSVDSVQLNLFEGHELKQSHRNRET